MAKRAVKSNSPISREGAIPITTALNISALAREHGVSRKTITRRLQKGWRPTPHTPAHAHPAATASAAKRVSAVKIADAPVASVFVRARAPVSAHERPPLGVVRGVLLLLAVAFYVFVALAAVGHRG